MTEIFKYSEPFKMESGRVLASLHLAYSSYGKLNDSKNNVVWIFHALTANSDPCDWWSGLVGSDGLFTPEKHFIICVNMPGSCYGSIGPLDTDDNGEKWFHDFPFFTTRDMIRTYQLLRDSLGISKAFAGIGGSMGGQQLLEWAADEPLFFENIFPIACNAKHSPWGIAFNTAQRQCIETDPSWSTKNENAGLEGMKAARSIALLSYRNFQTYKVFQEDEDNEKITDFKSESYQRYQGEKLARRFNAFSYYFLGKSMDAHNLGRERGGLIPSLAKIQANTLVIGIETDVLFPVAEQEFIAKHIPGAKCSIIKSDYGHDGFLLEYEQITALIGSFLKNNILQPAGKVSG